MALAQTVLDSRAIPLIVMIRKQRGRAGRLSIGTRFDEIPSDLGNIFIRRREKPLSTALCRSLWNGKWN